MPPRIDLIAALTAVTCIASPVPEARAQGEFPAKATYLFYIGGEEAGRTDITSTAEDGRYVFTSEFSVRTGEETHSLSCRSEFDKKTLRPLAFRYEGDRNGASLSGALKLEPDSVRAVFEVSGRSMRRQLPWAEGMTIFQNYVTEHLAVLARRLAESGKAYDRFPILFPTEMMSSPTLAVVESEVELAVRPSPVVCTKYLVSVQNSFPFYMYVDSVHKYLIYIDFPPSKTEVFLQSAFGDRPETRYTAEPDPAPEE